jgi:hypothetical protein
MATHNYLVFREKSSKYGMCIEIEGVEDEVARITALASIGEFVLEALESILESRYPVDADIEVFMMVLDEDEHATMQSIKNDSEAVKNLLNDPRTYTN